MVYPGQGITFNKEPSAPLVPGVSQPAPGAVDRIEMAARLLGEAAKELDPMTGKAVGRIGLMLSNISSAMRRPPTETEPTMGTPEESPMRQMLMEMIARRQAAGQNIPPTAPPMMGGGQGIGG